MHSTLPDEVDVLVVGAGPCGAGAALAAARAGRSVLCVDARPLYLAGPTWTGALPVHLLRAAAVPSPNPEETFAHTPAIHMIVGSSRIAVRNLEMEEVRLGRFTARLQALASGAGARLLGEMPLAGLGAMDRAAEEKGPILASLPGKEVLARLVVDATGLTGVGRATWPALARACPPVDPTDLCLARQEDREVKDPVALRAWLGEQGVFGDDALSLTASFGGWSVEVLQWHAPFMGLLGGSIPGRGAPGGPELVRRLAARTPGLGAVTGHGEGWIPLRRPYDRLSAGPVLLLGSSACQVYASNACGVASGLLGARMLGTCLVGSSWEPAASAWRYACLFQRHWGGFLAGSTTTVDMAASLGQEGLERALSSGLLTPSLMEGGYGHRTRMPPPREWGALLRGMGREPGLARRVLEVPLRVSAIRAVYGTYPSSPTPGALSRWAARAAAVGNWEADPVE